MTWIAQTGITYLDGKEERFAAAGEPVPDAVVKKAPWLVEQRLVTDHGAAEEADDATRTR